MSRLPGFLARAVGGALVAVALLALAEGLLRLLDQPPSLYEGDPASFWALRPGLDLDVPHDGAAFHVTTNPLGLRGELPPDAGPWTLALGCSTTFGWGVEDDEAWPAALGALIDEPVINGGVPGWSTAQAVRGAQRWVDLKPRRIILAFGVRDAWPADRPDAEVRPTPWPLRTRLASLMRPGRSQTELGRPGQDPSHSRVPPQEFAANLRALVTLAGDAEVWLLVMPLPWPDALGPWVEAMGALDAPVLAPMLPEGEHFFAGDPVHLNAEGHRTLAEALEASLARGAR